MAAQPQNEPIFTWLVLLLLLAIGLFGIWGMTHMVTGPAIITLKQYELWPLTFFSDDARMAYNKIVSYREFIRQYMYAGQEFTSKQMWDLMIDSGKLSGNCYRFIVGFILIGMGMWVLFFTSPSKFKNRHTLESLMRVQAICWPSIAPFLKYNPAEGNGRVPGARVPLELPMFAEALYPEEWMAHNRIRVVNGVPDRDQIRRALLVQLGDRFDGIDNLPEHLYCLLAAFVLKGGRKRKESDDLLGEIAKCWNHESGFSPSSHVKSAASRALHDSKLVQPLLDVMNRHAYVATAMIAALGWARRQGGVLAPAQFVWLRGEDRDMWYSLNNLGRRAFHVEAAGAMSHYMAEVEANRSLVMPRLDSAVVAIVQYLSETRAKIPEIDGTESAKPEKQIARSGRPDALMLTSSKQTKH